MSLQFSVRIWLSCVAVASLTVGSACRKTLPASAPTGALGPAVQQPASEAPYLPTPLVGAAAPRESEPTAGRWATYLLPSANAVSVANPPDANATRAETEELQRLSGQRSEAELRSIAWWDAGGVRRWNEIAREIAASQHLNSSNAARMFALLAVAQHDALVTAWHYKYRFKRLAPTAAGVQGGVAVRSAERYSYPSGAAAVAAASASVLSYIAEPQSKFLWRNAEIHRDSRVWAGAVYPSDVQAGWEIGLAVARRAQEWGEADKARTAHTRPIARQEGKWWTGRQTMPGWGKVKPWLMKSVADFRAPEPPAYDSPQFHGALKEVRQIADSRTAEQLLLAKYWDLGVGAISVPGMWDQTGIDLMTDAGFSEPRMARALALTNMAMMDASIACWETKFHYLVRRPTMVDSKIVCAMEVPEHPSYPSGHADFSGAASAVLGYVLPEKAGWLNALAEQAAMSRLYGGLHYRFDNDTGLKQGREVAQLAIARGKSDGCPPVTGSKTTIPSRASGLPGRPASGHGAG